MTTYRVLQMTNNNIGAVAVTNLLPFGITTRRVCRSKNVAMPTFSIGNSGADTITVNEPGNYKITYTLTGVAAAAGILGLDVLVNGASITTVGSTVAAGDTATLNTAYEIRVLPNSCSTPNNSPVNIQVQLTGVGISGGNSNIIVERVY